MQSILASQLFLPMMAAVLAGGAVLSVGGAVVLLWRRREPSWRRLQDLAGADASQAPGMFNSLRAAAIKALSKLSAPARPKESWEVSRLRRELTQAGFPSPHAANTYLGIRVVLALIMPGLAMLTPVPERLTGALLVLALIFAAGLGFMAPAFVLNVLVRKRQAKISSELPDVLDLLVIAVEAGLGMDAAVQRVAREVSLSAPVLSMEFKLVALELKAGIPRARALRNLATRCGVEEVSSLVTMLIQADRFGVSVGRSLRVHSDTVRTKRRQRLEEAAAKIPLKLLFPVLFLIFPAIMAVMAGPAIIRVSESIMK